MKITKLNECTVKSLTWHMLLENWIVVSCWKISVNINMICMCQSEKGKYGNLRVLFLFHQDLCNAHKCLDYLRNLFVVACLLKKRLFCCFLFLRISQNTSTLQFMSFILFIVYFHLKYWCQCLVTSASEKGENSK